MIRYTSELAQHLADGGIAVIPTDTLYGIIARVDRPEAVDRVYSVKQRDKSKPCIVLIDDVERLRDFGVAQAYIDEASKYWPGAVSVVIPVSDAKWSTIARGGDSIAFRVPAVPELCELLSATGPLIAPSANPESLPPAQTSDEAEAYFGRSVDYYVDGGTLAGKASTIIDLVSHRHLRD